MYLPNPQGTEKKKKSKQTNPKQAQAVFYSSFIEPTEPELLS